MRNKYYFDLAIDTNSPLTDKEKEDLLYAIGKQLRLHEMRVGFLSGTKEIIQLVLTKKENK